jgi:hypothetical protein
MTVRGHIFVLAAALVLATAPAAWSQTSPALLARPDARITLQVDVVPLGELLAFLAAVGDSTVTLEPDVRGTVRDVALSGVRVEDAFRQLASANGLVVRRVGTQLIVGRNAKAVPPPPPITPDRSRPELLRPPTP